MSKGFWRVTVECDRPNGDPRVYVVVDDGQVELDESAAKQFMFSAACQRAVAALEDLV